MKYVFLILIASLSLAACSKSEKDEGSPQGTNSSANETSGVDANSNGTSEVQNSDNSVDEEKTEKILGKPFPITNETKNKDLKLEAFETDISKDDKYYYDLKIENLGESVIQLNDYKIKLVDSFGKEHRVGLIDDNISDVVLPKSAITGLVGFDKIKGDKPKQLKIVD